MFTIGQNVTVETLTRF